MYSSCGVKVFADSVVVPPPAKDSFRIGGAVPLITGRSISTSPNVDLRPMPTSKVGNSALSHFPPTASPSARLNMSRYDWQHCLWTAQPAWHKFIHLSTLRLKTEFQFFFQNNVKASKDLDSIQNDKQSGDIWWLQHVLCGCWTPYNIHPLKVHSSFEASTTLPHLPFV